MTDTTERLDALEREAVKKHLPLDDEGAERFLDMMARVMDHHTSRLGQRADGSTVYWADAPGDDLGIICPYCKESCFKTAFHECENVGYRFVVPASARWLMKVAARAPSDEDCDPRHWCECGVYLPDVTDGISRHRPDCTTPAEAQLANSNSSGLSSPEQ